MHGLAINATTNQFILGLNATATDDAVNKPNDTKYTSYKDNIIFTSTLLYVQLTFLPLTSLMVVHAKGIKP